MTLGAGDLKMVPLGGGAGPRMEAAAALGFVVGLEGGPVVELDGEVELVDDEEEATAGFPFAALSFPLGMLTLGRLGCGGGTVS